MSTTNNENELTAWYSSYGSLTAKRILNTYGIELSTSHLLEGLKNPQAFYYLLMRIPLQNISNGVVLQHIYEYQVYAQKLFIDYLMSGNIDESEALGANTRAQLEEERMNLVNMNERVRELENKQNLLISESQAVLKKIAKQWQSALTQLIQPLTKSLRPYSISDESVILNLLIIITLHHDFKNEHSMKEEDWQRVEDIFENKITPEIQERLLDAVTTLKPFTDEVEALFPQFLGPIAEMNTTLRQYRLEFRQYILRVLELIRLLPQYDVDNRKNEKNLESLKFIPFEEEGAV